MVKKNLENNTILINDYQAKYLGIRPNNWDDWTINNEPVTLKAIDLTEVAWNLPLVFVKAEAYLKYPTTVQVESCKGKNFQQLTETAFIPAAAAQRTIAVTGLDYNKMFELFYKKEPVKREFDPKKYEQICAKFEADLPTETSEKIQAISQLQDTFLSLHTDFLLSAQDPDIKGKIQEFAVRLSQLLEKVGFVFPTKEF